MCCRGLPARISNFVFVLTCYSLLYIYYLLPTVLLTVNFPASLTIHTCTSTASWKSNATNSFPGNDTEVDSCFRRAPHRGFQTLLISESIDIWWYFWKYKKGIFGKPVRNTSDNQKVTYNEYGKVMWANYVLYMKYCEIIINMTNINLKTWPDLICRKPA